MECEYTSHMIGQVLEKEYKNVLADIKSLTCSEAFSRLNFELSEC